MQSLLFVSLITFLFFSYLFFSLCFTRSYNTYRKRYFSVGSRLATSSSSLRLFLLRNPRSPSERTRYFVMVETIYTSIERPRRVSHDRRRSSAHADRCVFSVGFKWLRSFLHLRAYVYMYVDFDTRQSKQTFAAWCCCRCCRRRRRRHSCCCCRRFFSLYRPRRSLDENVFETFSYRIDYVIPIKPIRSRVD